MIKAIDFKKVEMNQEEFDYFNDIVKRFSDDKTRGIEYFRDLFEVDRNGIITIVKPIRSVPMEVLFFLLNLMINQRLREQDKKIEEIKSKGKI